MKKPFIITLLLLLFSSTLLLKAQDNIKPAAQPNSMIKIIPFGEGRH